MVILLRDFLLYPIAVQQAFTPGTQRLKRALPMVEGCVSQALRGGVLFMYNKHGS
jgi:hypothetical protein